MTRGQTLRIEPQSAIANRPTEVGVIFLIWRYPSRCDPVSGSVDVTGAVTAECQSFCACRAIRVCLSGRPLSHKLAFEWAEPSHPRRDAVAQASQHQQSDDPPATAIPAAESGCRRHWLRRDIRGCGGECHRLASVRLSAGGSRTQNRLTNKTARLARIDQDAHATGGRQNSYEFCYTKLASSADSLQDAVRERLFTFPTTCATGWFDACEVVHLFAVRHRCQIG